VDTAKADLQDRINQVQSQINGLEQLMADGTLSWDDYTAAALPLYQAVVARYEELQSKYPALRGNAAFNISMQQALGQLAVFAMRGRRPSNPAMQDGGYSTAIGAAMPSAAGQDPAVSAKPSLLKPPKFWEGLDSDEPIRGWLTSVAHWLSMSKVPRGEAVGTAANYLRGKAQAYWFSMVDTLRREGKDPTVWDTFRDQMILAYGAIDPEYVARTKIDALRQNGSVESYVRELQMLFAELIRQPMHEADKVHKFFTGLNPGLAMKTQVNPATSDRWTTFAAAAAYVIKQEILYQANKPTKPSKTPPSDAGYDRREPRVERRPFKRQRRNGKHKGGRPFNNNKQGGRPATNGNNGGGGSGAGSSGAHWHPPSKAERDDRFKRGVCIWCGHPDHKKADCPHNRDKQG
jgi:hypothetical protein